MTVKVRLIRGKWTIKVDWHRRRIAKVMPSQARALEVAEKVKNALEVYGEDAFRILEDNRQVSIVPTLRDFGRRWITEQKNLKPSTRYGREYHLEHYIFPDLGHLRLDEITHAKLKAWLLGLADARARGTVASIHKHLRACLQEALAEGLIQVNPALKMGKYYQSARSAHEEIDPFTLEELWLIESIAAEWYPEWYEFILVLSRTGMRAGEARGLRWSDIDWKRDQIVIRRNMPTGFTEPETTKTRAGRRNVDMSPELDAALASLKRRRLEQWMKKGRALPDLIFCTQAGNPIIYAHFHERCWQPLLRLSGLHYRRPHDLRHSFASLLLSQGEDPAYVSTQLGHASLAVTLGIYAHWVPGSTRVGAAGLDRRGATKAQQEADKTSTRDAND